MPKKETKLTQEEMRLKEVGKEYVPPWQKWGPYVSERAWGTVREDYSYDGDAWNYFPSDLATRKAFRWGEDGIAGWCDRYQVLVFAPAFWNGKDPILKERLFGLNANEGNHGEDVKECYFHLDGLPSHAYMKYLYKYPHSEFPYQKLREENRNRDTFQPEYELIDTGIFSEHRYFDIFIEYAKADHEDTCIAIEIYNRSNEPAPLHLLTQLWFRNQWIWGENPQPQPRIIKGPKNSLVADDQQLHSPSNLSFDYHLGKRYLYGPEGAELLFTDNETSSEKEGFFKDAFHRYLINGERQSINPLETGTKACLYYFFESIPGHGSVKLQFRLTPHRMKEPLKDVMDVIEKRRKEADEFYAKIHPKEATHEEQLIQRQALAGLLWSKQIYLFDVDRWFKGDNPIFPPPESRYNVRNMHWQHLNSMRILLMPDKWEYPWFAAWDHAFHCITYALMDISYAKEQLWLLLFDQFQHPNGQIPACEWEFSDMNPPVQAWAALQIYNMEKEKHGVEDREFLERCFHKLLMNFSWWVNKVDSSGNNVFEGGFLGLDNITVLDRSQKFAGGVTLQQSDGTGWMAMFCLNLMRIALILAVQDKVYESLATKFFEHYVYIAHAMKTRGNRNYEMWSDRDGFFYDVLSYPDGNFEKFRVRSLVGLIPLYAVEILHEEEIKKFPEFYQNFHWFLKNRKDLVEPCIIHTEKEGKKAHLLALMNQEQLRSVLGYVWNPEEFRSSFGIRSLSKYHEKHPFVFRDRQVGYEPADSLYKVKGGNSNWRGPIWIPTTYLLIESFHKLAKIFGEGLKVAAPNEQPVDLKTIAYSFAHRTLSIFMKNHEGRRPFQGADFPFKTDPHWRDYILFYEYFNPETGKGHGASHQTGWSALIANLFDEFRKS